MKATGVSTEVALADALGFKPAAFSNRKKRGALPREEVDALIASRRINANWVYTGIGPMFDDSDLDEKRLKDYQDLVAQMQAMSMSQAAKQVVAPIIKGVVWGDAAGVETVLEELSELSSAERALLLAYRNSPLEVRSAIEVVAGLSAPRKQGRSVTQVMHGPVGQVIEGGFKAEGPFTIQMPSPTPRTTRSKPKD
jgi:hypothetical protein